MTAPTIVSRELNFESLMANTEFRIDQERAHITVDSEICRLAWCFHGAHSPPASPLAGW